MAHNNTPVPVSADDIALTVSHIAARGNVIEVGPALNRLPARDAALVVDNIIAALDVYAAKLWEVA